jgi:protease I
LRFDIVQKSIATMKKVGILLDFDYEDLEVWYPLLRLREAGHETFTIAPEKGKVYNSKHGYACTSDFSIEQVTNESLDALVIPGGWCPDYLRRDARFLDLVRTMVSQNKPVAAICHGPWMLCSAKCIKGRRMTSYIAIKDDVENAGAIYEDAAVVVDGSLITSRMPCDLPQFCTAILKQLQ